MFCAGKKIGKNLAGPLVWIWRSWTNIAEKSVRPLPCLALSLADVVQMFAGGIVIDTMFIDEGFGSLDSESLKSAVDTLLSLGEGNRLVGIISHVPQLKEQIYRQIQVLPGYHGSTIQIQA